MQSSFTTPRLIVQKLTLKDAAFVQELVNTPAWLEFIGNRNIYNLNDAKIYVKKIMAQKDIHYWVVKLRKTQTPIGIITLLKRPHLAYYDIGFAFLNFYKKQGYAFEATSAILEEASKTYPNILAITLKNNVASIKLIEKLGFKFDKETVVEKETLLIYQMKSITS